PQPPALAIEARALAPGRLVVAGLEGEVRPDEVVLDPQGRPTLRIGTRTIRLPLVGRHLAGNAMLAWAVAEELGLDLDEVADALSRVVVPGGRSELQQIGGLTILNDCYNANPASFLAAIETAQSLRTGRRLVFVAGGMRELGPDAERLHAEVAAHLLALAPELLVAVGEFADLFRSQRDALGDRLILAGDPVEAGALLAPRLSGDEVVVLKASRGVALERILPAITSQTAPSFEA
ncbi:MAG: cyanophycin synthetase, partial [Gemmatimonadota bacterium]